MRGRAAPGGRAGCSSCWWTEPTIQPLPPRWLGAERDIPSSCLMIRSAISTHRDLTNFIETTPSSCGIIGRRFKDQFPPWEATSRGANGLNPPARWVVNQLRWKCYVLSLLKIQHPDCELCNAREKYGVEMRRRLEELNWRTQPHSINDGVFDSETGEVVASPPISLAQQQKKIAQPQKKIA